MEENRVPTAHHFITEEVVKSLPDGMSFPVIVKPVDCNSSKGVVKVNSNLELQEAVNTAIRYSRTDNAIVEDFVSGRELTIDAFVQGGKSQVLCISELDKIKSNNSFIIFRSMNPARVMPRTKGSKNRPKTTTNSVSKTDYASQITEKQSEITTLTTEITSIQKQIEENKATLKDKRAALKKAEKELSKLEAKKTAADQKAAEEAKKAEAESVVKKLIDSGMSVDEIIEKLK